MSRDVAPPEGPEAPGTDGANPPRLELPALPPVIVATPLAIALLLQWLLGLLPLALPTRTALIAGGLLVLAGLLLGGWAILSFLREGEDPHPPTPTRVIVETGPYRFSRNPMYLALSLVALGIALGLRSWIALLSVPVSLAAVHLLVVRREEAHLERTLGEPYRAYKARVRRYL